MTTETKKEIEELPGSACKLLTQPLHVDVTPEAPHGWTELKKLVIEVEA
jgi:hypothetical protein